MSDQEITPARKRISPDSAIKLITTVYSLDVDHSGLIQPGDWRN